MLDINSFNRKDLPCIFGGKGFSCLIRFADPEQHNPKKTFFTNFVLNSRHDTQYNDSRYNDNQHDHTQHIGLICDTLH